LIKILIADDENLAREDIKYFLNKYEEFHVIGEAKDGKEVLDMNQKLKPDLIFLDIKMPVFNGIEIARIINNFKVKPEIIFLTAYDEFALDAFSLNALDYLLKPISEERFSQMVNKLLSRFQNNENIQNEAKNNIYNNSTQVISAHKNGVIIPIKFKDIIYATIDNKDTILVTKNDSYKVNMTLSELYNLVKEHNFFRTHKSFIVNINFIEKIEPWFNSTYNIKMIGKDSNIPVSRNYVREFRDRMNIN